MSLTVILLTEDGKEVKFVGVKSASLEHHYDRPLPLTTFGRVVPVLEETTLQFEAEASDHLGFMPHCSGAEVYPQINGHVQIVAHDNFILIDEATGAESRYTSEDRALKAWLRTHYLDSRSPCPSCGRPTCWLHNPLEAT